MGRPTGERVNYALGADAWQGFEQLICRSVDSIMARSVCEIGGGANPLLSVDYVLEKTLRYVIIDISQTELDKAPQNYEKVCADIMEGPLPVDGDCDLVFSRMLAEHVRDGARFHRNVWNLLRPGGRAIHFFPTLYAPPFVLNALLPERLADAVLHIVQAGRERAGRRAKFPAYYSWCCGPTNAQFDRFQMLGYEIELYVGFFGHAGYYSKLPVLERLHRRLAAWLVNHPISYLTSFAWVVLTKIK